MIEVRKTDNPNAPSPTEIDGALHASLCADRRHLRQSIKADDAGGKSRKVHEQRGGGSTPSRQAKLRNLSNSLMVSRRSAASPIIDHLIG
jgi:hypothetical protein